MYPLASADVGAAAVDGVEGGRKELVANLERVGEAFADRQRVQRGLFDMLTGAAVDVGHVGEIGDDRPRRDAGEENAGAEKEGTDKRSKERTNERT